MAARATPRRPLGLTNDAHSAPTMRYVGARWRPPAPPSKKAPEQKKTLHGTIGPAGQCPERQGLGPG